MITYLWPLVFWAVFLWLGGLPALGALAAACAASVLVMLFVELVS